MKQTKFRLPSNTGKMTKEEFLITWVLARASFREDFSGTAAAKAAEDVWRFIQEAKNRT